ncbi:MAG: glycosyltransferase family 4 protein [Candidatus Pacebacteria bacterium]|nr:glycosyltransferase family 4 protein [Candidatus Paceibacterota bacterium]
MKIGIDARSLEHSKTGVRRYLANLLEFWKNEKNNQFILYFKDKIPNDELIDSDNFKKVLLKNSLGFSSNFFFQHFLLPYNLKKDKVDFFFSPFYLKPLYCPVRSSIVLHDISYESHPEWFDRKSQFILRKLSKISAKKAKKIFTVSDYSKGEIIKYYHTDHNKITVTNLAPDSSFEKIEDINKINAIKEKYKIKKKFIFCLGTIFSRRHIAEIIDAFEKISLECDEYQLLIVGKNKTYPFIDINNKIEIINNRSKENSIVHLDFVSEEELLVFYSLCDLIIYLSDYEGFGLPVIEAQFFGKPVITSYNSSLVDVGGDSVEFVKDNTVDEICESMGKLISDKRYKLDLIKRGNENVKRFSWERCAKETLERILNIEY